MLPFFVATRGKAWIRRSLYLQLKFVFVWTLGSGEASFRSLCCTWEWAPGFRYRSWAKPDGADQVHQAGKVCKCRRNLTSSLRITLLNVFFWFMFQRGPCLQATWTRTARFWPGEPGLGGICQLWEPVRWASGLFGHGRSVLRYRLPLFRTSPWFFLCSSHPCVGPVLVVCGAGLDGIILVH